MTIGEAMDRFEEKHPWMTWWFILICPWGVSWLWLNQDEEL